VSGRRRPGPLGRPFPLSEKSSVAESFIAVPQGSGPPA